MPSLWSLYLNGVIMSHGLQKPIASTMKIESKGRVTLPRISSCRNSALHFPQNPLKRVHRTPFSKTSGKEIDSSGSAKSSDRVTGLSGLYLHGGGPEDTSRCG